MQTLTQTRPLARLSDSLSLFAIDLAADAPAAKPMAVKTHHILQIDCSGSMSDQLPLIRKHIKNRVASLVKEGDLLSIGWFSGRIDYGILLETVEIKDLVDLSPVHAAVDRYLRPMGLTGFVGPLRKTAELLKDVQRQHPQHANSLFFMSDGHDNQWNRTDVLAACRELAPLVSSPVIVEYGYYCNRPLLLEMAEALGGSHIFAEGFSSYEPLLENVLQRAVISTKKREVAVDADDLVLPIAYALEQMGDETQVVTYAIEQGRVQVPEHVQTLYLIGKPSPRQIASTGQAQALGLAQPALGALLLLSQRLDSARAREVLRFLGDVALIKQFGSAYGKQALSDFQAQVLKHLSGAPLYTQGYDPNLVPAPDAFCVLDLVGLLVADDQARYYPRHEAFNYRRISAKAGFGFTESEKEKLSALNASLLAVTSADEAQTLTAAIAALVAERTPLRTEYINPNPAVYFSTLVWNENRPNLSVLARFDIRVHLPANPYSLTSVESCTYRTYTLIQDGIINVKTLPVSVSAPTFSKLQAEGLIPADAVWTADGIYALNLAQLPVINQVRATGVSAAETAQATWKLYEAKAYAKAVKARLDALRPDAGSIGLAAIYGQEAANWLAGLGITDRGYSPNTVSQKSGEELQAVELLVKIPKFSTLPSVKAAQEKKKPNAADQMVLDALAKVDAALAPFGGQEAHEISYLQIEEKRAKLAERAAAHALSERKMGLLLSQGWFTEFASLDEHSLEVELGGEDRTVDFESRAIAVKI